MIRLNRWLAGASDLSRRGADEAIAAGRVMINGQLATLGAQVNDGDVVTLDDKLLHERPRTYLLFHKPIGYVCSRRQQGNVPTIFALLPENLRQVNPVGRLDKDSSGLLLLTDDGDLAQALTHPSKQKDKHYLVELDKPLTVEHQCLLQTGVELHDGPSKLRLTGSGRSWEVVIHEGRNRQIRRSFSALGYHVKKLHRTSFGPYELGSLKPGEFQPFKPVDA